jgi:hypothetical protein
MLDFLDELETAGSEAWSVYLPFGLSLPEVDDLLRNAFGTQDIPGDLSELAASSATGSVILWGSLGRYLVSPPFPIAAEYLTQGYDVEPLRSLLRRDFSVALVLVRLGAYAIGLCKGDNLIASKVGTGLIHGRHKKGGSSQQRFQRHREKQIESFLERVCSHIRDKLGPQASTLDYLVYGGSRTAILSLQRRCSLLQQFENRTLAPLLDIPDPRKTVLDKAVERVWSSNVTEWYWDEALT